MNLINELKNYFPTYEVSLPVSKINASFTPFKVKDAKNLSIILQENNKKLALKALYEILKNNTQNVVIDDLCLADAEYLFLHIRSKSIDEIISVVYENEKHKLNIFDIICLNELKTKIIKIGSNITIELCTPTIKDLLHLESFEKNDFYKCFIKKIIVKNEIYEFKKFIPDEVKNLIDNLPISILNDLDAFVAEQPKLIAKLKLSDDSEKEVSGLLDFFIFR